MSHLNRTPKAMKHRLQYMQQAIELAQKGTPKAYPNPLVGCVIVFKEEVIARGYHKQYGGAHAEVNAIHQVVSQISTIKKVHPNLLFSECTLYVSLEPCSHFGKTPPCTDLIIEKGFKKVVVGALDPNPLVAGRGIQKLKEAGIEVITGVLEEEVKKQNARFFTFHQKQRPYFILKWAQTANGFISKLPVPSNRAENLISNSLSNKMVHILRTSCQAIMVGKNTVLADNPHLTVRWTEGKSPIRLVIDKNLEIPNHFNVYNYEASTVIFNSLRDEKLDNVQLVKLNFKSDVLPQIVNYLYEQNVQGVLVEGGSILLNSFIKSELWDELLIIKNTTLQFDNGVKAPVLNRLLDKPEAVLGNDDLYRFYNT